MSDTLTPERIAELRAVVAAAKEEVDENEYRGRTEGYRYSADDAMRATFTTQTLSEVLDAAEERAALRAERDAALTAKQQADTYADDITGCLECIAEAVTGDSDTAGIVNKVEALVAENARLRDLLARVQVDDRWRPIETAPKDGRDVWIRPRLRLWMAGTEHHGQWDDNRYAKKPRPFWTAEGMDTTWSRQNQPTHWRPLPLTPAEEAELDALRNAVAMEGETP